LDVGVQLAARGSNICKVKGLARIVPLAIGARSFVARRSELLDKLIGVLTPAVGVGMGGPSLGIAWKEEVFKHPLAESVPTPSRLIGDPKKLEVEVATGTTDPGEATVKLTGELFPSTQAAGSVGIQYAPSWALNSVSGAVGVDHPLFDIRVCGFVSVGTVSFVASGSVQAKGLSSSAVSGSVDLGLKLVAPFLPEVTFTILKVPDK
jgi:hypothetical protein